MRTVSMTQLILDNDWQLDNYQLSTRTIIGWSRRWKLGRGHVASEVALVYRPNRGSGQGSFGHGSWKLFGNQSRIFASIFSLLDIFHHIYRMHLVCGLHALHFFSPEAEIAVSFNFIWLKEEAIAGLSCWICHWEQSA